MMARLPIALPVLILLLSLLFPVFYPPSCHDVDRLTEAPRILLLTAHPDDECMFFAPTLLGLGPFSKGAKAPGSVSPEVFSLCLSVGNADGIGVLRRLELARSLDVLGVPETRRWIEDRSDLQDNLTAQWSHDIVADVLRPYVLENSIDTILTFDGHGVSGHPNHISLPHGVARLLSSFPSSMDSAQARTRPRLFTLVSVNLLHKYTGPLAPLLSKSSASLSDGWRTLTRRHTGVKASHSFVRSSGEGTSRSNAGRKTVAGARRGPVFVAGVQEYATALRAMMQHRSQLVWFRWLYVTFSRYMWVNEWVEVVVPTGTGDV